MRVWKWLGVAALTMLAAGLVVTAAATQDVRAKRTRLEAERQLAQTRYGSIEYASWGNGPAVPVFHGAGGGFDQGRLIAEAFGGDGFQWIAPSRFGYLGSPLPSDASTAAQADAFADLLDHLGVDRVAILGFSGGVPPALQFAERYPDRTAAVALLSSAPFTPYAPRPQQRPIPDWVYQALFANDVIYWALAKASPRTLREAFDVRPDLSANLPQQEREFVARLVDAFLPASLRVAGVRNEGAAIDPEATYALESIAAPTLVIHARDDHINDFEIGVAISQRVPGAEFVPIDAGGHLLLGHHEDVQTRVSSFIAQNFDAGEDPER